MMAAAMEKHLEDETAFLQLGQTNESIFYGFKLDPTKSSSWNKFPTLEKPDNIMNYARVNIYLHKNKTITSR